MPQQTQVYKRIAIALGCVGGAAFLIALAAYGIALPGPLSDRSADWGTFGDFIGGIAGTVIALSTLVALVIALHLQARELSDTRTVLAQQVEAMQGQMKAVRLYEDRRVQPLLKAEWTLEADPYQTEDNQKIFWRIANVGLGPCILDKVELFAGSVKIGSHGFESTEPAHYVWSQAFAKIFVNKWPGEDRVRIDSLHDLKRALAVGETLRTVTLICSGFVDASTALQILNRSLRIVIHFRSLADVHLTTDNQFDALVRDSGVTDLL